MTHTYIIHDRAGNAFYTDPLHKDAQLELESAFRNQSKDDILVPLPTGRAASPTTIMNIHGYDIIVLRKDI